MKNEPLISVIIPVYNVEAYLKRCLDSICGQIYQNLEILLVDDGATDRSGSICDDYAKKDSRICVIHKENGGLSSARNAGLDAAKGSYVAFIDSDDFIASDYVSFLWQMMEAHQADIVHGLVERGSQSDFSERRKATEIRIFEGPEFLRHYFDPSLKSFGLCVNKLYRRGLFKDVRFPEGRVHEDVATVYKVLYEAKKVVYTDRILYYYYMSPDSIMRRQFRMNRLDWIPALQEKLQFLQEHQEIALYNRSLQEYQAVLLKLYFNVKKFFPDEQYVYRQIRQESIGNFTELISKKEIGIAAKLLFCGGRVFPYWIGMLCDRII